MADGDSENYFEISENFDYILFADQLVNYVMHQKISDYVAEPFLITSRRFAAICFNVTIKRAIYILGKEMEGINMDLFNRMYQNLQISSFHYTVFFGGLQQSLFGPGFNGRLFLMYCAGISNVAAYFYNCGIHDAPNLAKAHIFYILRNLMPADGWNILNMAAKEYIEMFLYYTR